jgi:FlaA1/EpsC-like NDP-sugar epimerase
MFTEAENDVGFMPAQQSFLNGKTIIITGGSRGIGRKIALRAAKDGANVVIVAKTTDPNPKVLIYKVWLTLMAH